MSPSRSFHFRALAALASLAGLSACAAVPDLGTAPTLRTASAIAAEKSLSPNAAASWPREEWWKGYGDPQLDALIVQGLRDSPDAMAAAARFRRAQAMAQAAGAPLLPSADLQADGGLQKQSYTVGFPKEFVPKGWQDRGQVALDLSFDLDLWGKNRAALAAATSEAEAARIEQSQARLALSTAIATAYIDLAREHADRDVIAAALDLRLATQKLVAHRVEIGLDTRAELKQADAAVPLARADLQAADEAIALTRHQIAALVGAGPDLGLTLARPRLDRIQQTDIPSGTTTDLVGRRPDIAAARARVEATASRIKAARADFYPAITLGALVGFQSLGLENLSKQDSLFGNVGPAISLPLFHGGAISGRYRGTRADYDEAVANYDRTILSAYREVADAVTSQRSVRERLVQSRQSLVDSEEAYSIARKRFEGGLSNYLNVLSAEQMLLQARRSVADLDARRFAIDIALVRALGGGFDQASDLAKDNKNG